MSQPLVSFLMPTRGRPALQPELVDEALYYFTLVDYPEKELLILNDAPDQTLVTKVPQVRIINTGTFVPTMGDKMNVLVEQAKGEICLVYEDDDLVNPWRAKQAVERLEGCECWFPALWWYWQVDSVPKPDGNGVGYTSAAWRRKPVLGKHAPVIKGHDQPAKAYMLKHLKCNPDVLKRPEEISYWYRWGVSQVHLSAQPDPDYCYKTAPHGPPGTYELRARRGRIDFVTWHWRRCAELQANR